MTIHGAVIIEQGVTFAIVAVKPEVTRYTVRLTAARHELAPVIPHIPILLIRQAADATPHYYGRKDIVDFLKTIRIEQIPWKTYHFY